MAHETLSRWHTPAIGHTLPRVTSHLSALDLGPEAEALYRRILRAAAPDVLQKHAAELGWAASTAAGHLDALVTLRLVRVYDDGAIEADDPRAALERVIDTEEAGLDARRARLARTREAISEFSAERWVEPPGGGPRHPAVERLAPEVAPGVVERLLRDAEGPIRQVDLTRNGVVRAAREAAPRGREQLTIYPLTALQDRRWTTGMRAWARAGEVQRVIDGPPTEFSVLGAETVLTTGRWGVPDRGYALIRDPMLVGAFGALFDELWRRAQPVHDGSADDEDSRILELMLLGYKDEAIARYLGAGLRTVRRRIAALMAVLGVDTRFQLGTEAQRRGLLD